MRSQASTPTAASTATSTHNSARPDESPPTRRCHCSAPSAPSATSPTSRATDCGSSARVRERLGVLGLTLAQLDAADLAGQGLREVVHELDLPRVGVGGQAGTHMVLDVAYQLVRSLVAFGEHDECLHDAAAPLVGGR